MSWTNYLYTLYPVIQCCVLSMPKWSRPTQQRVAHHCNILSLLHVYCIHCTLHAAQQITSKLHMTYLCLYELTFATWQNDFPLRFSPTGKVTLNAIHQFAYGINTVPVYQIFLKHKSREQSVTLMASWFGSLCCCCCPGDSFSDANVTESSMHI